MKGFLSSFREVDYAGTNDSYSTLTNKRIILSNRISLFCVSITIFFIGYYMLINLGQLVLIETVFAILYALPVLINYLKYTLLSRVYLCLLFIGHVFFLSLILGHTSNMYLFYIPITMAPFVLFEFSQRKIITGMSVLIILIVGFLFADSYGEKESSVIALTERQADGLNKVIFYVIIACCSVIIYSILYVNESTTRQLDMDKENLQAQLEALFTNSVDALFLVDGTRRKIVKANMRAVEMFEADSEASFYDKYGLDLHKEYPSDETVDNMRGTLWAQKVYEEEILYKTFKGNEFWGALSVKLIEINGEKYQSVRVTNISEQRRLKSHTEESLKEKELLLAEIHHRVKNNLAIISALINLQIENLKDEESKVIFEETKDRIYSMALIHNQLYQNNSFAQIEFSQYINNFCSYLVKSYQINPNIEVVEKAEKILLDIKKAIPCALILNELITNSFKHAFKNQVKGEIEVGLKRENEKILFWVSDTGTGMDDKLLQSSSMGMTLVTSLIEQIDGKLNFCNKTGSKFLITFLN